MRLFPSVEGSASPLITHRIGVDVCLARQGAHFHKCHRCIYRGQAADWEPANPPLAMVEVLAGSAGGGNLKPVEIPRPAEAAPLRRAAAHG